MTEPDNNPFTAGDRVILAGTIRALTPGGLIQFVPDRASVPEQDTDSDPSLFTVTARQLVKGSLGDMAQARKVSTALRTAAEHIRNLRRAMNDDARIASAREDALLTAIARMGSSSNLPMGPTCFGERDSGGFERHLERLADSVESPAAPEQPAEDSTGTSTQLN